MIRLASFSCALALLVSSIAVVASVSDASISVVDTSTELETARVRFYDPNPAAISVTDATTCMAVGVKKATG